MRFFSSSSLTSRIFFASAVLLPLLLGFSGTMLNHAFKRSLQASEREALRGQLYLLLGAAEPDQDGLLMPPSLAEPRYSTINSGLYGWIVDKQGKLIWRSASLELYSDSALPILPHEFEAGREKFFRHTSLNSHAIFTFTYDTIWDIEGADQGYRFVVGHSQSTLKAELEAYRKRLLKWLGGLALLLTLVQTFIARWGLKPLRKLAQDLEYIEAGTRQRLQGEYPDDIKPVTENLNKVLYSEQTQRERYRNTLSDLAHSLKTPLSVIRGQLESQQNHQQGPLVEIVDEQINRMSMIVDHQLRRASAQVTQATHHTPIDVTQICERLISAIQKVYQHKNMQCELNIVKKPRFLGEEADLMELAGNLIENACKYGRSKVLVSAEQLKHDLQITIEDDGPGVPDRAKSTILNRGARADTATSGQGIGLAVAVDIVSSYGGSLKVEDSPLGGARFIITIPQVIRG